MRRIQTQKEKERKKRKKDTIITLTLLGILILATVGYTLMQGNNQEDSKTIEINGRTFTNLGTTWGIQYANQPYYFSELPNETSNIQVTMNKTPSDYYGQTLYLSQENEYTQFILTNLPSLERSQLACVDSSNPINDVPCEDTTLPTKNCSSNLFIFVESDQTKVEQQDNCIIFYGDFGKAVDAFFYNLIKIN
jgi:hypothetical protein